MTEQMVSTESEFVQGMVETITELRGVNVELLEALRTTRIVSMGHGPLAHEIIEATCDSAIKKAKGETNEPA